MAVQAKSEGKLPGRQLNVVHAAVSAGCEDISRHHTFTVQSTEEGEGSAGRAPMFELQADGNAEQQDWMTCIQVEVCLCILLLLRAVLAAPRDA